MMLSTIFGKSPATLEAERDLRDQEDRFMEFDPAESENLKLHTRLSIQRHGLQLKRLRVIQAVGEQNADRSLFAQIIGFAALVVVIKGDALYAFFRFILAHL